MLEADLVASRAAVTHLICREVEKGQCNGPYCRGFYCSEDAFGSNKNEKTKVAANNQWFEALLIQTSQQIRSSTTKQFVSDPDDQMARIRDFIAEIRDPGKFLWQHTRLLISECLARRKVSGSAGLYGEAVGRSVDETFFSTGSQVPSFSSTSHTAPDTLLPTGDVHVHIGGAIPWEVQWSRLMAGKYPVWYYSKAKTRLVSPGEFVRLLGIAVKIRQKLACRYGPKDFLPEPSFDVLLYRRLYGIGNTALDDHMVRDYVLIRSLVRREMLVGDVSSLDEYTGQAWKRFWGGGPNSYWDTPFWRIIIKRIERLEKEKFFIAANSTLANCKADLRTNLEWPPNRSAMQLKNAKKIFKKFGAQIIIHGRRPKKEDLRVEIINGELENDYLLRNWDAQVDLIRRIDKDKFICGLDLAGPERNTPTSWFDKAIESIVNSDRGVTIHAGEDFYDPLHGLVRVAVVLNRCNNNSRSFRIGHGSVLGINPYELKWGAGFQCPLWVRRESLCHAIKLGNNYKCLNNNLLYDLEKKLSELPSLRDDERSLHLMLQVQPDENEKLSFQKLQQCLISKLIDAGAVIESNPTSNLRVLGLPGYAWAPFWGLVGKRLNVALGTDNPGIMNTNIEEEYSHLRCSWEERLTLERRYYGDSGPLWKKVKNIQQKEINYQEAVEKVWFIIEKKIRETTLNHSKFS